MLSSRTTLHVRMVIAVAALVIVTIAFLAGIWAVFYGLFVTIMIPFASELAALIAIATLLETVYLEYKQIDRIERLADAHPIDTEEYPELYQLVTKIATQLDVPVPTIALSDRNVPEALAIGFRPRNVHLILSTGTLNALDEAELEAVIAHELAHVKNGDALIMTVLSLPVIAADEVRSSLQETNEPNQAWFIIGPLYVVSTVSWVIGRSITARVSRVRERVADQTAANVTGSPTALASALSRLDQEIQETPSWDLRDASGITSLSILPLEPREIEKIMLGPDGDIEPSYWELRKRLHRVERWLFGTHPPTDERITSLVEMERDR